MPGLGEGAKITKPDGSRWYSDEFDRIKLSIEIVEENWRWFEEWFEIIKQTKNENNTS